MTHLDLRDKFTQFWQARGHKEVPSIPLVPENDPTTLFTGSGMQQLIPYLMGQPHPLGGELYNIQRSFRTQDIEKVGDNRHTTFFEMIGNWSLGDYFKEKQIPWFFEFLTKELGFDEKRLYVSIFKGSNNIPADEETANLWKKLGILENQIVYYGADKNWWSRAGTPEQMPEGEIGGPDSEVFYDLGTRHNTKFGKVCHPNCDCGRFIEIGNSVFIQYKKVDGEIVELPNKNVDFGGGLERILTVLQGKKSIFETDVFYPIIQKIEQLADKKYGADENSNRSFRILADHLRAAVFLIADGILPSNKEQGYILRRLIRRAVRFGNNLALKENSFSKIAAEVAGIFEKPYPHLKKNENRIIQALEEEEKKFRRTLKQGVKEFEKIAQKENIISANTAFFLYESYGFPLELTEELAREKNFKFDKEGILQEKIRHKKASQKGMEKKFRGGLADHSLQTIKYHTATHLLHQALRIVLDNHVEQKGSNITVERLRFDFSHPNKLTSEEIKKIEIIINQKIEENLSVSFEVTNYKEAVKQGALAFFGQRYPEQVKVYSIGSFSKEVCGGPHVETTGILGKFQIIKEESAGAGIRRVYAILA